MAQFEDAATGWEIFRDRAGTVSRAQLNQALRARGRKPIADRTFSHYRKLMRLGYYEYISINRLDVRHANDSVFDVSDRSRYLDRDVGSPGRLILPTGSGLVELSGRIGKVSEGFATLRVRRSEAAIGAARATKYDKGVLIFEQVDVERAVQVVEGVERGNDIDLLLEFRSLLETDLLLEESPFPQGESLLVLDLGANASLYRVLGAIHTTFDLFESVRGFVDVASASATDEPPRMPTLRVRQLQFSNPLETIVFGAVSVVLGVTFVISRVSATVKQAADATSNVQGVTHAGTAERRRAEMHEAELKSLQLDNLKKAIEVAAMLDAVRPSVSEVSV